MKRTGYTHIFFDLDHTLWDHERNSRETLDELFDTYALQDFGLSCKNSFFQTFDAINRELWDRREKDLLPIDQLRRQRNELLVDRCNLNLYRKQALDRFADLNVSYLQKCPAKPHLLPFATDLLEQLQPYYKLHILTNGFADIQQIKLQASGISQYFTMVVTPEEAGAPKPSPRYFSYVLDSLKAQPKHCLMIGDNINTDISGALSSGIDAVYINSNNKLHTFDLVADVQCLSELLNRF